MNLTLNYVPNMDHFLHMVNYCSGLIFLELKDCSYLNLKGKGEGKLFLESMGSNVNGLRVVTEKPEDAALLLETLISS